MILKTFTFNLYHLKNTLMKFYAYIPDSKGNEPLGTSDRMLFELKTVAGAIRRVKSFPRYRDGFRLYSYVDFYNESTFRLIHS